MPNAAAARAAAAAATRPRLPLPFRRVGLPFAFLLYTTIPP